MARLSGEQADDAAAREEHHGQQDEAEHELPAVGPAADESLQQDEESGAGERPEEAPDAAEDDEDDELAGALPRQHGRTDDAVQLGEECAGKAGHHGREREGGERPRKGGDDEVGGAVRGPAREWATGVDPRLQQTAEVATNAEEKDC